MTGLIVVCRIEGGPLFAAGGGGGAGILWAGQSAQLSWILLCGAPEEPPVGLLTDTLAHG